jgi:7,8-dihydropterin-6-yl-methyl-4-(beta-D-ribofuranosyl)aminobenzene 5'-phosphate synthase
MTVRATILCENSVYGLVDVMAEHGWSVCLETQSGVFLFDTGPGRSLLPNAARFGIPLADVKAILLSHHHVDHTGGLLPAVKTICHHGSGRDVVPVYAHPDLFKDSFYDEEEGLEFIGLPNTRRVLEVAGAEFHLRTGWQEVAPDLYMTGEVPRVSIFEIGDPKLRHGNDVGNLTVDPVRDDQTVIIDTPDGLFVVLGCSHAGVINILTYIQERMGKTRFHTVMGGTHLGVAGEEQIAETIAALGQFDIGRLAVSHCTGPKVAARMAQACGDRFVFGSVGTVLEA